MSFRVSADGEAVFDSGVITGDSQPRPAKTTPSSPSHASSKAQSPPKLDQDKTP
jgi:hypothetical protein